MIRSMTAYASRNGSLGPRRWTWEMRSVNGRGLDVRLRLPEGLPGLETTLRTALKGALSRGTVTIGLRIQRDDGGAAARLDSAALDAALAALGEVQARAAERGLDLVAPTGAEVLGLPGVMATGSGDEADDEALLAALALDIGPLLADFTSMRATEGRALQKAIARHLDRIAILVDEAAELAEARKPEVRKALREAFQRVMAEVTDADEGRIAQELALLAVKQDVTEEIDRLRAHVGAAFALLDEKGALGRKLDFLSQEFMREANTLCSKSQNAALTAVGLELKSVIDQMREQVQNVE